MDRDEEIEHLVKKLAKVCVRNEKTLSLAESCTGGWMSKVITDRPGSSEWFGYGMVTYSDDAKRRVLRVEKTALTTHGAVSQEVVEAMADGIRRISKSDYAVAVSGVAGPGGGTKEKPVGTVWCAWAVGEDVTSAVNQFRGGRDKVRRDTVYWALEGMLERILSGY